MARVPNGWMMAGQPKDVDWAGVETAYRAGTKTLRAIGKEFGVSNVAVLKRAKRDGWDRDLRARISAQAEAKVSATMVSAEVSKSKSANEKAIIEANAQVQANIILSHRKDVPRVRGLLTKLMSELEGTTDAREDLERIGEILASGDEAKMADLYRKLMGLPGRIESGKKLADALRIAVTLEREVFGIAGSGPQDGDQVVIIRREIVRA